MDDEYSGTDELTNDRLYMKHQPPTPERLPATWLCATRAASHTRDGIPSVSSVFSPRNAPNRIRCAPASKSRSYNVARRGNRERRGLEDEQRRKEETVEVLYGVKCYHESYPSGSVVGERSVVIECAIEWINDDE
jgi:hypothetical protein